MSQEPQFAGEWFSRQVSFSLGFRLDSTETKFSEGLYIFIFRNVWGINHGERDVCCSI